MSFSISIYFLLAILLIATVSDLKTNKIPNILSLGSWILGILFQTFSFGFDGLIDSISGLLVGLAIFLPFYLVKGMAAGDVKLMAGVGAFLGAKLVFLSAAATLVWGGVIALLFIISNKGFFSTFQRWYLMLATFFVSREYIYIKPKIGEVAGYQFPYAIAIFAGTTTVIYFT